MENTTRTEVTIETQEVTVIRFRNKAAKVFCERCGEDIPEVAPDQAAEAPDIVGLPPALRRKQDAPGEGTSSVEHRRSKSGDRR